MIIFLLLSLSHFYIQCFHEQIKRNYGFSYSDLWELLNFVDCISSIESLLFAINIFS